MQRAFTVYLRLDHIKAMCKEIIASFPATFNKQTKNAARASGVFDVEETPRTREYGRSEACFIHARKKRDYAIMCDPSMEIFTPTH